MKEETKLISKNSKAYYDYQILETMEAGIELKGTEIKSIRAGNVSIRESFARIVKGEIFLFNCHISPYSHGNLNNHEPLRERKILMHRKEIDKLIGKIHQKGLSLVPVAMYFKRQRVKVALGLAKGKKVHDKRETIKKRDIKREQARYDISM